ncbi:MAG: nucleotidyltransferase [Actinomycetota bacterium]
MTLEAKLSGWTGPSSDAEQERQERTERMIREAIDAHPPFNSCSLSVYAKGSYPNNTNVRADSDVDISVQCHEVLYFDEATPGSRTSGSPYEGIWTPYKLRSELEQALIAKFGTQVDTTGNVAIAINSSTSRVDADVTPCFDYRYYFANNRFREGARIYKRLAGSVENYPKQHLENGRAKNSATSTRFKKLVRILKRVNNTMNAESYHRDVPSFFIECLVYNCPNSVFNGSTWAARVKAALVHIFESLDGAEPETESQRWTQVDGCKFLFHSGQKWTRQDGRDFAKAAWNHLGLADA